MTEADARPRGVQPWSLLLDRLAETVPSRVEGLTPALQLLRSAGGEGLLAAVVAPPPGTDPVARHPDVRSLLQAGRVFSGRVALVVDVSRGRDARAEQTVAVLRAAGWRATTIAVGEPLADRWQTLAGARSGASAYQPGAAR